MRDSRIRCLLVVTVGVIGCTGVSRPDPGIRWVVPTLAKGPNSMDGRSYTYNYVIEGDRLSITRAADGAIRVTTLLRVE